MELSNCSVFADSLSKILYSTDASAYREVPYGVCYPKNKNDLKEAIKLASKEGITIIPRTAGTSLAGQVVGSGLVVDMSRYMNSILEIEPNEKFAWVEPGVVLDTLNNVTVSHSLFFGPETSTSNRCCIGGMVGNNSCGSHSLVYGSTRDHLLEAKVILADGSEAHFKDLTEQEFKDKCKLNNLEGEIYRYFESLITNERALKEIQDNFPDPEVKRRNCGYALDEFIKSRYNLCSILAGSEGTLALAYELKIGLVDLPPKYSMLVCAHATELDSVFRANLIALSHGPVAVELMDSNILELSKGNISQSKNRFFIEGSPAAILICELADDDIDTLKERAKRLEKELISSGLIYYCSEVFGSDIPKVWSLRKAGLGLLSSMNGDAKPVPVIEDTAVAPSKLPDYMRDFDALLKEFDLSCVYYAHIGTGELHLRPVLNLKKSKDVELFREIAYRTALLVKKYRGSLSGEHGDGRLRGEFIPLMYGDYIYNLMRELKKVFDSNSIFNANKIVDTPPMNSSLRYSAQATPLNIKSYFNFSSTGGWLSAIEQCNGSGDCRKAVEFGGTMCPSFRATNEEKDSTRGRANTLRELLTYPKSNRVFNQKEILESLDLCLSCKGCKNECPSNVDMAKYKAEFLQHHYDSSGAPFRSYIISRMAFFMKMAHFFPNLYNKIASSGFSSRLIKKVLQFAVERDLPQVSTVSVRKYAKIASSRLLASKKEYKLVYLFADEFTVYNEAQVAIEFIDLLTLLGYLVVVPKHYESGRAAISKGFVKRAAKLANKNVSALKDIVTQESPLIGIEPSTILSFRDEYPQLVEGDLVEDAVKLSKNALMFDEFIVKEFKNGKISRDRFTDSELSILLHGHCHQKALASVDASCDMLSIPRNYKVSKINSGCCGMAGSFGYEREHYKISMAIGEQTLFPAVRSANSDITIAAPGISCRQQILDGTSKEALHPVQILNRALLK